jgi:DNA-binding MarR family transcriptional regulator
MARPRTELRSATKLKLEQIIRYQMLDLTVDQIADALGMTPGNITDMMKHKDYAEVRTKYVEKCFGPVDAVIQQRKANVVLEDTSADAADALAEILRDTDDEVNKRLTATAILDRSGFGPIQRKAVRARLELDPVAANLLSKAMGLADQAEQEIIDLEAEEVE